MDTVYYWTCVQKRCGNKLDRCRATLISRLGAGCQHEFESPGGHTHPPNLLKNDCLRYRQSLKRRSKETNEVPSVTISVCATSVPKEVILLIQQMLLSSYYFLIHLHRYKGCYRNQHKGKFAREAENVRKHIRKFRWPQKITLTSTNGIPKLWTVNHSWWDIIMSKVV